MGRAALGLAPPDLARLDRWRAVVGDEHEVDRQPLGSPVQPGREPRRQQRVALRLQRVEIEVGEQLLGQDLAHAVGAGGRPQLAGHALDAAGLRRGHHDDLVHVRVGVLVAVQPQRHLLGQQRHRHGADLLVRDRVDTIAVGRASGHVFRSCRREISNGTLRVAAGADRGA